MALNRKSFKFLKITILVLLTYSLIGSIFISINKLLSEDTTFVSVESDQSIFYPTFSICPDISDYSLHPNSTFDDLNLLIDNTKKLYSAILYKYQSNK